MKRIILLAVIAASLSLATACGSPAPVARQAPVAGLASTQSPASTNDTEVEVTLADNTVRSSLTTFQAGVPYSFVIKNTGTHVHDFNISTPVSVAGSLDAALAGALLVVKQDQLPPGATVSVPYTFPDSAAGAQLEFSCLIPRHYEDGMRLAITVTK